MSGPATEVFEYAKELGKRCESEASLTIKEHLVLDGATEQNHQVLSILGQGLNGLEVGRKGITFAGNLIGDIGFINEEVRV